MIYFFMKHFLVPLIPRRWRNFFSLGERREKWYLRLSPALHFFLYPLQQFRTSLFTTGTTPFGIPRRGSIFRRVPASFLKRNDAKNFMVLFEDHCWFPFSLCSVNYDSLQRNFLFIFTQSILYSFDRKLNFSILISN